MPVDLRAIELFRVRLPLALPFRTAIGTTSCKDALLVRVVTVEGEGWGELGAQATSSYAPETLDTARLVIRDELAPRLFDGAGVDDVRGHHAAKASLECAQLDARLRAQGISLASHLGGSASQVAAGVAIGMHDDISSLLATASGYVAQGYGSVKLKIAPGRDVRVAAAVRAEVGTSVTLQVDANGAYALADAERLAELDALDISSLEQPLPPDALLDHAQLATRMRTTVCLDESITSARLARDAIALGACRAVSIKAGLVGGLAEARRAHDMCVAAGVAARAGGMLETGIGRAALVALASLPGFTLTGDVSASNRYFDEDVTEPFELHDGRIAVPTGPGLGVTPRPGALAKFTVARERLLPRD